MDEIDERIFELIELLKTTGEVASDYNFAQLINRVPQHINNVKRYERRHFTLKDVYTICERFNVNPSWILGFEKKMFINVKES